MAGLSDRLLSALAYIEQPERAQQPRRRRYELPEIPASPLPLMGAPGPQGGAGAALAAVPQAKPSQGAQGRQRGVVYVGDSMGVGTAPYVQGAREDVVGGRGSASGVAALRRMLGKRDAGSVVFDLGTNDWTRGDLAQSIRQAQRLAARGRPTQLIIPTVHGRRAAQKNRLIRRVADRAPNVEVVDWARAPDRLLSSDRIHATPQGYRRRARMISRYL